MPFQNRVDPLGEIQAVPQRGTFTGNRGVIHDPATRTLLKRRWTSKAWLICALEFDDRLPRDVMGYNSRLGSGAGWTELFFLDEVTALAAGHRPCFFCRREAARRFQACFPIDGIDALPASPPGSRLSTLPGAPAMDARLHAERLASGGTPRPLTKQDAAALPDGAMVLVGSAPHAVRAGRLLPWSHAGYGKPLDRSAVHTEALSLITPPSTVEVLRAGYRPIWHPCAGS